MHDSALANLLLASSPADILLIGEPVHRLVAEIRSQFVESESAAVPAPVSAPVSAPVPSPVPSPAYVYESTPASVSASASESPRIRCLSSLSECVSLQEVAQGSDVLPVEFSNCVISLYLSTDESMKNVPSNSTLSLADKSAIKRQAERQLGMACRLAPKLVVVEHERRHENDGLLADDVFFAFGFKRLSAPLAQPQVTSDPNRAWYMYSLREYKRAPEWLNSRFWAHPERFNITD